MLTTDTNRICQKCGEPKPLTDYRRRWRDRDVRMNVCNSCHYASERARRVHKKQEAIERVVRNFIRKWRRGKANAWDFTKAQIKVGNSKPFFDLLIDRIGRDEAIRAYRGQPPSLVRSA